MMKRYAILLLFPLLWLGCTRGEYIAGQETNVSFQTSILGDDANVTNASFSRMRLIVSDKSYIVNRVYSFSKDDIKNNNLSINLPLGKYYISFIANGSTDDEVSYTVGEHIDKIFLNLQKNGSSYREAADFLTATQEIEIEEDMPQGPIAVQLKRKVGKLIVKLNNISASVDSILLEVSGVPTSRSIHRDIFGKEGKIVKAMDYTKGETSCTTEVLSFPVAAEKAEIGVLYMKNQVTRRASMLLTPAIEANRMVEANGTFSLTQAQTFNFSVQDWNGEIINGGNFEMLDSDEVIADNRPASGEPVGDNLLTNGGFETWTGGVPTSWELNKDGKNNVVAQNTVSEHLSSGNSSVRLAHQTYFYQDIPVEERKCYQIKLKVKSTATSYKWRVFCTWRDTPSKALSADHNEAIQTKESGKTEGWQEIFSPNDKFRAPVGARILRVEVRTYSPSGDTTPGAEEGVYLDDCKVYLLQE